MEKFIFDLQRFATWTFNKIKDADDDAAAKRKGYYYFNGANVADVIDGAIPGTVTFVGSVEEDEEVAGAYNITAVTEIQLGGRNVTFTKINAESEVIAEDLLITNLGGSKVTLGEIDEDFGDKIITFAGTFSSDTDDRVAMHVVGTILTWINMDKGGSVTIAPEDNNGDRFYVSDPEGDVVYQVVVGPAPDDENNVDGVGFTYTATSSTKATLTINNDPTNWTVDDPSTSGIVIASVGKAQTVYLPKSADQTKGSIVSLGGILESSYLLSANGNAYFDVSNGDDGGLESATFHFMDQGDAIEVTADTLAPGEEVTPLSLRYNTSDKFKTIPVPVAVGDLAPVGRLTWTQGSSATEFSLVLDAEEDGAGSVVITEDGVTEAAEGEDEPALPTVTFDHVGGEVLFDASVKPANGSLLGVNFDLTDASTSSATFANLPLNSKGTGYNLLINGATVHVDGANALTYTIDEDLGQILSIDAANPNFDLAITATGDAMQLRVPSGSVTIGGTAFTVTVENQQRSYFLLDGSNNVTGFYFGADSDALAIADISALDDFGLYSGDPDAPQTIDGFPAISGSGAVLIAQDGAGGYLLTVGAGVVLESNGQTLDFSGLTEGNFVTIGFDEDGFTSIDLAEANPFDEDADEPAWTVNDSIVVSGITATDIGEGIQIDGTYVGVASGNFTYGFETIDDEVTPVITLAETDDTVFDTGFAAKVYPASTEGTLTDFVNEITYDYSCGGSAFFAADGAINGFVFGQQGDALTISGNGDFTLGYRSGDDVVTIEGFTAPKFKGTGYRVEWTDAGNVNTFSVSGFGNSPVTLGGSQFTFADDDSVITFDVTGGKAVFSGVIGSTGDDTISTTDDNITIAGNEGNDLIAGSGVGNVFIYNAGDGDDTINGFSTTSTLRIDSGTYSTLVSGDDITVNIINGSILLRDAANLADLNISGTYESPNQFYNDTDNTTITATNDADTIQNRGSNVIIRALGGDDSIDSFADNVTIDGGAGDDSIDNYGKNSFVNGGTGNDSIYNSGENSTVNGGDGADTIEYSFGTNALLDGGTGNDSIHTYGTSNVTILGGDGKDTIEVGMGTGTISVDGGADDDFIFHDDARVEYHTLSGGNGNDTIANGGAYSSISGGQGNDLIINHGKEAFIDAGDGNDTIHINTGDFGISMAYDGGYQSTVRGGKGDDLIDNDGGDITFIYDDGDGNDTITGFNDDDTLQIGDGTGTYHAERILDDYIVTVGTGSITLKGATNFDPSELHISGRADSSTNLMIIHGTDNADTILSSIEGATILAQGGNDFINNFYPHSIDPRYTVSSDNVSLDGGDGVDTITNGGENVTIQGGAGADSIDNSGANALIAGGDGADTITNSGYNSTIDGGAGNDSISNSGSNALIDAGDGNDTIESSGSGTLLGGAGNDSIVNTDYDVTIDAGEGDDTIESSGSGTLLGGAGNDFISLSSDGEGRVIQFTAGDGNDVVTGLNTSDSLSLSGGAYTVQASGNDVVISATSGSLTLKNSATKLTSLNIIRDENAPLVYMLTEGDDTFENTMSNTNIKARGGNDSISNEFANVTIEGAAGADTITNDYGSKVTILGGEGNDSISNYNAKNVAIDAGEGNDFIEETGGENVTITSGAGNDSIYLGFSKKATVNAGDGSDTINTYNGENLTLDGGAGDDSIYNGASNTFIIGGDGADTLGNGGDNVTIAGGAGDDTIKNDYGDNVTFVYAAGDGKDTIDGFNETSTLDLGGATYNSQTSGDDITITVGEGSVLLRGAAELDALNIIGKEEDGWQLDGTTATFGDALKLTGIGSLDGITFDGNKTVTLSAAALNGENVTITKGYTLKIDGTVPTSSTKTKATWTSDGDEHTYTAAGTPAYYKLASNKLTFTPAKGGEQFTLTGIASTSGVKVSGTKVTIGKTALGDSDITLTTKDGFTLALDKSVTAAKEIKSGWKKFTYTAAGTTAGYVLDGDTITHTAATGGETFTISGLKNTSDVTVEDYVVTIGAGSLNGKAVTFSGDDFEFALGEDVPTTATEVEGGFTSVTKGTATYRTAHTSEAYELGDGTITYTAAVGGQDIKISNLNKTATEEEVADAIDITGDESDLKITFNDAAVLTTKAPTITAPKSVKYTVAVDEALSTAEETLNWKPKGTAATLSADTGATYTVKSNKVVYTKAKSGTAQAVLTGLAKDAELATPEENVITLDAENLGTKTSLKSNAGGYEIKLTGDMDGKTFVGSAAADIIDIAAANALVDGGKGNDEFNISGADVTIISSAGNDTTNFADGLTVSLSGTTTVKELAQTDSGVQLTFSNKATLTVAEVTNTFEVVGKKQTFTVDTDKFALADSLTFSGKSVTVAADFTGALTPDDDIYTGGKLSTVTTFDASAVTAGISIDGNAKANYITGGEGDDTLWGGAGNDTLIGGDGSDTFIYNNGEGKDVISGFADNDLLQITGNFTTSVNKTGTEIALKVGKGSLTLKNFTATDFNINGEVYQISGTKLAK